MKKHFWVIYSPLILSILAISFLFLVHSILLPFIMAFFITYIINPYVNKLEKLNIPRSLAACLLIGGFFISIVAFIVILFPVLYKESILFLHTIPDMNKMLQKKLHHLIPNINHYLILENFQKYGEQISKYGVSLLSSLLNNLWLSGIAIFNLLSFLFITPIITFYLIRDWKSITLAINNLVARYDNGVLQPGLDNLNSTLSKYIGGQLKICVIIGVYNSILLSALKLNYSLFIGITTGVLSFIPYVGSLFSVIVGNFIGILQFSSHLKMLVILNLIFLVGNIVENMVLSPTLVGKSVNLHPVWIMFALFAGGNIGGFTGILLAVPVAATMRIIIKLILQYSLKQNEAVKPSITT